MGDDVDDAIAVALQVLCDGHGRGLRVGDEAIADAVDVLQAAPMSRAKSLAKARYARLKKSKAPVKPHTAAKIAKHNEDVVRSTERIDLDEHTPSKQTRKTVRRWQPKAVLRACFSRRRKETKSKTKAAIRMRRLRRRNAVGRVKRKAKRVRTNPNSRATSAVADQCDASTSYVQELRDAVCQFMMDKQIEAVKSNRRGDHCIAEITLDETEHKISQKRVLLRVKRIKHVNIVVPVLVMHCILKFVAEEDEAAKLVELCLPMLAMVAKTGDVMMSALMSCVTSYFDHVKHVCNSTTLILVTDWAKANKLLFRKMLSELQFGFALHGKCMMHQVFLACAMAAKPLRLMGPVFCGSLLMHRNCTQTSIANALYSYFDKPNMLAIVFEEPHDVEQRSYVDKLLQLLHWDEEVAFVRFHY